MPDRMFSEQRRQAAEAELRERLAAERADGRRWLVVMQGLGMADIAEAQATFDGLERASPCIELTSSGGTTSRAAGAGVDSCASASRMFVGLDDRERVRGHAGRRRGRGRQGRLAG